MWNVITHLFAFTGGTLLGIVMMCLLQTGKQEDELMEEMHRRDINERGRNEGTV